MKTKLSRFLRSQTSTFTLLVAIIIIAILSYRYLIVKSNLTDTSLSLELTIKDYENRITELESKLREEQGINIDLNDALEDEEEKVKDLGKEVRDIVGTVNDLEKLSKTDEELLQKYSIVYFLNEHYTPSRLTNIESKYLYIQNETKQIHRNVEDFLEDLMDDAKSSDMDLKIISAYRSFGTQAALKSNYVVTYGSGANTFSADQGYSEHQLGTTVDFTTTQIGGAFTKFENTPEYTWLLNNAHRHGFTLSYPQGNSYYQFEPWHWRFVGENLAKDLHGNGVHFYDWDQRDINDYLLNIFD